MDIYHSDWRQGIEKAESCAEEKDDGGDEPYEISVRSFPAEHYSERYSADKNGGACDASDDEYGVARCEAIQSGFGERG